MLCVLSAIWVLACSESSSAPNEGVEAISSANENSSSSVWEKNSFAHLSSVSDEQERSSSEWNFSSAEAASSASGEIPISFAMSSTAGESSSSMKSATSSASEDTGESSAGMSSSGEDSIWIKAKSMAELSEKALERAAEFRKAVVDSRTRNGMYVYSTTVNSYSAAPEKLAARLAVFGFKDVYLSPGSTSYYKNPSDWVKTFIRTSSSFGMDVHAMRLSVVGGNTDLLTSENAVDEEVELVVSYNAQVAEAEKFSGISADVEVHTVKSGFSFVWDKDAQSDSLLRMAQSTLERAKQTLKKANPELKLAEAIAMQYDKYYNAGTFTHGSTSQFLESCDWVILMDYYTAESQYMRYAKASLDNAQKDRSVNIAIKVKKNANGTIDYFSTWDDMMVAVKDLFNGYVSYAVNGKLPFRGIDFFSFEGFEQLWSD